MFKNKLNIILVLGTIFLGASLAYAANLNFSTNYDVNLLNPAITLVVVNGSKAQSLIIDSGDLKVVVGQGDIFEISSGSRDITVSGNTSATVTQSCENGNVARVHIVGGSGGETITLTPTASQCAINNGGGGAAPPSGGGGGGGGSFTISTTASTTASSTVSVTQPANCPTGYICTPNATSNITTTTTVSTSVNGGIFLRNLTIGSKGEDVRQLQIFLNSQGFIVANSGAGSPGQETTYFGVKTRAALALFQQAHNIKPAAGYFGPITRAFIKAM